jgi:cytochrome c oxidase subunit 2
VFRSVVLFAILVMVFGAVAPVLAQQDTNPYTHIDPKSPEGRTIQDLYKLIFWMGVVVFIFVQFLIVYTSMRFKRRRTHTSRPAQVHGHRTLEITWTIIPAIILLIIAVPTITTIYNAYAAAEDTEEAMIVDVYGKQWWWEIHYPGMGPVGEDGQPTDLVTANEIRIPEDQKVVFRLYSNNVIHSFWIPELTGKMDVIPGHERRLSITPETSGTYYGECAEFCGVAHAWMRFVVKVQPQAEFDTWVTAMNSGPDTPTAAFAPEGDVSRAPAEFSACLLCHNVTGVSEAAAEGIATDPSSVGAGPNLTLLSCRDTLAAGLLENTPENLALWLLNPGHVKEGNYMHGVTPGIKNQDEANTYPNQVLSGEDVTAIVNYLESLQPAAGCPEDGVARGNMNTGANAGNAPVLATPAAGTPAPTGGGEDVTGAGSSEAGAGTPATEGEPIAPAATPVAINP